MPRPAVTLGLGLVLISNVLRSAITDAVTSAEVALTAALSGSMHAISICLRTSPPPARVLDLRCQLQPAEVSSTQCPA